MAAPLQSTYGKLAKSQVNRVDLKLKSTVISFSVSMSSSSLNFWSEKNTLYLVLCALHFAMPSCTRCVARRHCFIERWFEKAGAQPPTSQVRSKLPGNQWGSQQLLSSLPPPLFLEAWRQGYLQSCQKLITDDLYDQDAGYCDVKYLFALFPPIPLPHKLQYNQAAQSLSPCFSFSGFIEKIQCLKTSWYYLMIFW